jgi:hypothetical protein
MGDVAFIKRLLEFNKDGITQAVQKKLVKYIEDPLFTPEQVQKQSNAATSLCMWVRAMDVYAKIAKVVAPKKEVCFEPVLISLLTFDPLGAVDIHQLCKSYLGPPFFGLVIPFSL